MNVFELFAKLGLDTTEYIKGINSATSAFTNFGKLTSSIAKTTVTAAVKLGTEAISTTAKVLTSATSDVATYGDNVDKMSQKMGMSAKAYQEWDAVMQHSGASMDTLKMGMRTLATAAEKGNKAFEQLGLTQEQLSSMSQEELFGATIEALQKVENSTERTYLAGQLLGRGATELGALLNTSAEETQRMKDRVNELGGVMSNEAVKASAKFKDNMQDLTTAISGFKKGITANFLPGVNTVLEGLTNLVSGGKNADKQIAEGIDNIIKSFQQALGEGGIISQIIEKLPDLLPVLVNAAVQLFTGFVQALDMVIAKLEPLLPSIIDTIVNGLIKCLPMLVQGGFRLLLGIIQGIADNADKLVDAILDLIPQIIDTIIDNLPKIVEAAAKILFAIIQGIIEHLPELLEKIIELMGAVLAEIGGFMGKLIEKGGEIIGWIGDGISGAVGVIGDKIAEIWQSIKDFFKGIWDEACSIGENIIEGIVSGFTTAWDTLSGALTDDFFDNWMIGIKDIFGIFSPSHVMRDEVGKMLAEGIGVGFENEMDKVNKQMLDSVNTDFDVVENVTRNPDNSTNDPSATQSFSQQGQVITLVLTDNYGRIVAEGTVNDVNQLQGQLVSFGERGLAT